MYKSKFRKKWPLWLVLWSRVTNNMRNVTFCWLLHCVVSLSEVREVTAEQTVSENKLPHSYKPLFKQHNNIPQISFSCHQRPSSPHTQESMEEKNPLRTGDEDIRHLRAIEDDTRHRAVTQWAMYLSGCVCHGRENTQHYSLYV